MVQRRLVVQGSSTLTQTPREDLAPHNSVLPTVLGWRDGAGTLSMALSELWRCVEQLGWLQSSMPHIVLQIGQRWRSALTIETALSLARFLRQLEPHATIEVLDPAACGNTWESFAACDVVTEAPVCLADRATPEGLRVPALWFESYFLVTVAMVGPPRAGRFSGILDAQAEPLRQLGNAHPPEVLSYEAHRLARSDLAIACGYTHWKEPTSEPWWAVSPSDVAVDQALARAAGMRPERLAHLRLLASHEVLAPYPDMLGHLPRLHRYAPSVWQARTRFVGLQASTSWHTMVRDMRMVHRNLHRIPHFVRRRVAKMLRQRKQGSV